MTKYDIWTLFRKLRLYYNKQRVRNNKDITIVCNMCLGGVLYHDYGMRFCSPFINMMIPTSHFIELLAEIDLIADMDIIDVTPEGHRYPIGLLNSKWELHFMHYQTYYDAVTKWKKRCLRMDFSNIYFIMVETHSSSYSDIVAFDKLPFENKIVLSSKLYPEIKCASIIKGYDGVNKNGEILWPSNRWGACFYDQVDWLSFLNLNSSL